MRVRSAILFGGIITLSLGTACELLVDHDLSFNNAVADAATNDATTMPGVDGGGTACLSTQPPSSPPTNADGPDNFYLFAARTLDLVGAPPGFDLDHTCTCCACGAVPPTNDAGLSSCTPPPGPPLDCDGEGGIDSQFAVMIALASKLFTQHFVEEANTVAGCGERTIMFGLLDYNGLPDDPEVHLVTNTAFGVRDPHDAGEILDSGFQCGEAGAPYYLPKWDGTDLWSVAPNTATAGGAPLSTPIKGYVSNYHLVLDARDKDQLPNLIIAINLFGTSPIRFGSPILLATLVPLYADGGVIPMDGGVAIATPSLFAMADGQVAGRAERNDVLKGAALAPATEDGTPVCKNMEFDTLKGVLCGYADIELDSNDDSTNKLCNAFSASVSFTATPAMVGQLYDGGNASDASCDASQLTCDTD